MKRIFLVSMGNFPRGGCVANVDQYIARSAYEAGYEPFLFSTVNNEYISEPIEGAFKYQGITVLPGRLSHNGNKLVDSFNHTLGYAKQCANALQQANISKHDVVLVRIGTPYINAMVLKLRKKYGFKAIYMTGELFTFKDMCGSHKCKDILKASYSYIAQSVMRKRLARSFDLVLVLSGFLNDYYEKMGAKTALFPITFCDTAEYERVPKKLGKGEKYSFILTASGKMKDDLPSMLKGYAALESEEIQNTEFHLTGVKKETVKSILSTEEIGKVKGHLIIHNWMKYEELVTLLQKVHYIFLARRESQMTLANFPSKIPEAMQFGVVPVVSPVGDYTEYYLKDMYDSIFIEGFSTTEACRDAFRKAQRLSPDEYMQMSENTFNTAKERFDCHTLAPAWKEILDGLW